MHYELGSALKLVQKPIRGVPRGCLFFGRNFWLEINKRASQRVFTFGFLPNGIRNQNNVVKKSKLGLKRDLRLEEHLKLHNRSNYGLKLKRPSGNTFAHTFARRVSAYISPTSPVFRTRRLTTLWWTAFYSEFCSFFCSLGGLNIYPSWECATNRMRRSRTAGLLPSVARRRVFVIIVSVQKVSALRIKILVFSNRDDNWKSYLSLDAALFFQRSFDHSSKAKGNNKREF